MPGNKKPQGERKAYGEELRKREALTGDGLPDRDRTSQEPGLETDEERIAERQGKSGPGDVTDHESESERHAGAADETAPRRGVPEE